MVLAGFTEPQAGVGREETRLDRVILCSRITGICCGAGRAPDACLQLPLVCLRCLPDGGPFRVGPGGVGSSVPLAPVTYMDALDVRQIMRRRSVSFGQYFCRST